MWKWFKKKEIVGTCFGHAIVTSCIVQIGENYFVNLRLTENSWFPGTEIKGYPVELVEKLDEDNF